MRPADEQHRPHVQFEQPIYPIALPNAVRTIEFGAVEGVEHKGAVVSGRGVHELLVQKSSPLDDTKLRADLDGWIAVEVTKSERLSYTSRNGLRDVIVP